MLYRLDTLSESPINPVNGQEYDNSWVVLVLTESNDYQIMCGSSNGCAYTVKISKSNCADWKMKVGDFLGFSQAYEKNVIAVISAEALQSALSFYRGHTFYEPFLRSDEPSVLIHSTPMSNWEKIKRDGMLKSWNRLKIEQGITESHPIGKILGDPEDFRDYIMFGGGVTGEIVVNSRQKGSISMNIHAEYLPGARLYFDAEKMARDHLLVRDGCHIKVKDTLPLEPYLIWAATWESIGLPCQKSTPYIFAKRSDACFREKYPSYANI